MISSTNKLKLARTLLLCVLCYLSITEISYGQKPTKTSNSSDEWDIKWSASDEFNDPNPNWSKWIESGNLPNTTAWKWDNQNNVEINNGIASLTMRQNPNNYSDGGTYFKSGILKSYNTFTYGYFEAKIKGADIGEGVCPSFWLFSDFDRSVAEGQTIYSEIDIVELQQFDWYEGHQDDIQDIDLNLHAVIKQNGQDVWRRPKQHPNEQLNKWRAPWDPSKDFHIYGCEVNEQEIIWYIDGVEVARKPNTYWNRPMNVTLSLGLRKPFVEFYNNRNNAVNPETNPVANAKLPQMPTTMYVDYVRVWEKKKESTTPDTSIGNLQNNGFETGDLSAWEASAGSSAVVENNIKSGQYAGEVNNSSIAQVITLKANTEYTISAYGKTTSNNKAFLGINKQATNELVENYEFNQTSYNKGSITLTTGSTQEAYRVWFWSSGQAYCDDFSLKEGTNNGDNVIQVTGVSLSNTNLNIETGDTETLIATILPEHASNQNLIWSTTNTTVLSVDQNGLIKGLTQGSATVQVKTLDGDFIATCNVTVIPKTDTDSNLVTPKVGQTISIQSEENLYLTINTASKTALQATKGESNTFEKFIVVEDSGFLGFMSSETENYVTTASDNSIRCGATGFYNRQKFTLESNGTNGVYIKSKINNLYWKLDTSNSNRSITASVADKNDASIFYWTTTSQDSNSQTSTETLSMETLEGNNYEGVKIYPNPFSKGNLTINLETPFTGSITINQTNGQQIISFDVVNKKQVTLSESNLNLSSGMYLIKLKGANTSVTKKLIIK